MLSVFFYEYFKFVQYYLVDYEFPQRKKQLIQLKKHRYNHPHIRNGTERSQDLHKDTEHFCCLKFDGAVYFFMPSTSIVAFKM